MNHTPGPWYTASTGNHQGLVISEATSANVAVTYDSKDSAIVAAAPEMLAALEDARSGIGDLEGAHWRDRRRKLDAVIAKAKGEV